MNREILSAALFQHSSKVQPFKQESLDSIVERIIFFSKKSSLSSKEIQDIFVEIIGYCIPISIFESSIERLLTAKKIYVDQIIEDEYKISPTRSQEIEISETTSIKRREDLINKIFKNSPERKALYVEPFWFTISYIFSNIGDYSAKLVNGKIDKEQILFPILDNSIAECKKLFEIDFNFFKQKINEFFSELNDPLYNETKCVLAQNYFIAKSIGINPSSENFSREVFENQIIYLDTNVILAIISKNNRKHNNAIAFINAINKLKLKICVSHITTIEYENWVQNEFERIRKTDKQIPKNTKSKIESPVYRDYYQAYIEELEKENDVDSDLILQNIERDYLDYKNTLSNLFNKENLFFIDDVWFETIEKDPQFDFFVKHVKSKYSEVSTREKGEGASIHDAKLLLWLDKSSKESGKKHLFVTTDTSMPLIRFGDNENTNNIVLEAILQWLLPMTNGHNDNELDKTIAEILKQKILPKEFIFEIKDFLIFDQLHMECQELPAEDVENCILYLKKNASGLNPNNASDREKFANEIAKYFIDPGKKFKLELAEREKEIQNLADQLGDVYQTIEELKTQSETKEIALKNAEKEHSEEIEKIQGQHSEKIAKILGALTGVTGELDSIKEDRRQEKIREGIKIWKRPAKYALLLFVLMILFGIFEIIPDWGWNYPAKLLSWISSIETSSRGLFELCIGLNIFLLSGLVITLFIFCYNRLFNKNLIEKKQEELDTKIK